MNILALDYGSKRIGLAWVNTALGVVLPYGVIGLQSSDYRLQPLIDLIKTEKISQIVVGLPLGLDGKENGNTIKVRAFVAELKAASRVPIDMIDERFTSAEADRFGEAGASRDEKAAMIILQSYLERLAISE